LTVALPDVKRGKKRERWNKQGRGVKPGRKSTCTLEEET